MNTIGKRVTVILLAVVGMTTNGWAQGSLTPPGAPEPTMKTLQELWDQLQLQQGYINDLTYLASRTDQVVLSLSNQVSALSRAQFTSITAPLTVVVDSNAVYTSLAFSLSGRPAIGYQVNDDTVLSLKYAIWNGSSWAIQTVDADFAPGFDVSLAFEPAGIYAGNPAMSYYDFSNKDLNYAGWNGSTWVKSKVDTTNAVGEYSSLAFTAGGLPAISYYAGTEGHLKYAGYNGSTWVLYTVDGEGDVGQYTSLAFTTSGLPAISYYDVTSNDLKYAFWTGASWSTQRVDSAGDVGQYTSLAMTPSGNPAISYYDGLNGNLKYAVWNGASWAIQTVDSGGDVGQYTSLAFTPLGNPAISYYDASNFDLKYAVLNGSSWAIQTVDSGGDVGAYTSLAFTPAGNPAISYRDSTNGKLKYAEIIQAP